MLFLMDRDGSAVFFSFLFCAVLFLCGAVIGVYAATHIQEGLLQSFFYPFTFNSEFWKNGSSFVAAAADACKFHFAALLFGVSILGVAAIPLLSVLRGFALAFSMSVFLQSFSSAGTLSVLLVFGVPALVSIPSFFVIAVLGIRLSAALCKALFFAESSDLAMRSPRAAARVFASFLFPILAACYQSFVLPGILSHWIL